MNDGVNLKPCLSSFQTGSLLIVQPTDKTLDESNQQELVVGSCEDWLAEPQGKTGNQPSLPVAYCHGASATKTCTGHLSAGLFVLPWSGTVINGGSRFPPLLSSGVS